MASSSKKEAFKLALSQFQPSPNSRQPSFRLGEICYIWGSYWWDMEYRVCQDRSDFYELLGRRTENLSTAYQVEQPVVNVLRDCLAARYEMLARCPVEDFKRYCGMESQSTDPATGTLPPSRIMHVLISTKIMEALLDCCRDIGDFYDPGCIGNNKAKWEIRPSKSIYRQQVFDGSSDLVRLWSAVDNADQYRDDPQPLTLVNDPIYASLLQHYEAQWLKATAHTFVARLLKLAVHLRGFLLVIFLPIQFLMIRILIESPETSRSSWEGSSMDFHHEQTGWVRYPLPS